jgi:hypothetical protein
MKLNLLKHSRPDFSNSDKKLSKMAYGATEGHVKSLLCTMVDLLETSKHVILHHPHFNNDEI